MSSPTPEDRKRAQKLLDEAVEEWLRVNDFNGICTSWVMVSHLHNHDGDDGALSSYPIAFMNGDVPFHISIGLLTTGNDVVRGLGRWTRDED